MRTVTTSPWRKMRQSIVAWSVSGTPVLRMKPAFTWVVRAARAPPSQRPSVKPACVCNACSDGRGRSSIQMTISFQSSHAPIVNDTMRFVTGSVWLVTRRPKGPSTR